MRAETCTGNVPLSLMVPTFNRVEKLKICIGHIAAQTCKDFTLVVSNNGSNDGTREYLDSLPPSPNLIIKHLPENLGLVRNHEQCISLCDSEWIAFVSDDDRIAPDFVAQILPYLSSSKYAIIQPGFECRDQYGAVLARFAPDEIGFRPADALQEMLNHPVGGRIGCAGIAGFAMRRSALLQYQPFQDYPGAFFMDTYMYFCLAMAGGIQTIPPVIYTRVEWGGSATNAPRNFENQLKARKKFVREFRTELIARTRDWSPADKNDVLSSLRYWEVNTPFSLRRRIGRIEMMRRLLDLSWVKGLRRRLGQIP